jgi:hypothetical protein
VALRYLTPGRKTGGEAGGLHRPHCTTDWSAIVPALDGGGAFPIESNFKHDA